MSKINETDRLAAERECARLVTRYCHYVDHGEAEKIADLFTEDGVWSSPEITMSGHEELRRGFRHRQENTRRLSRHVCNNLLLDVAEDGKSVTGVVYLTLYRHDGEEGAQLAPLDGPAMVGEYRDRFVHTETGWRFADRRIAVNFIRSES